MPDIIEENEGEGNSAIQRRANALVLARAAAAAARANNNNNNNNNNGGGGGAVVAVPEGNAPAAPAAVAGAGAGAAGAAAVPANEAAEVTQIAAHLARLAGVDVRPMFRRLGVRRSPDIRYIREKDLDGLPRITAIQKRKVWAVLKYVATDNPPLTARTTLSEIAKTLNANKKKEKETTGTATTATATTSTALSTATMASSVVVPMVQVSKLDAFDGAHNNWVLWRNKSKYQLAATNLGLLLQVGDEGKNHAKKNPGQDYLLFNLLAEAIVGGSAKHLIHKAEQRQQTSSSPSASAAGASASASSATNGSKKSKPSGRVLWHLLMDEYSQGPIAFWILSDARQTLQKLHLVGSSSSSSSSNNNNETIINSSNDCNKNDNNNPFVTNSAHDYVNRFRFAKDTLAEYNQALPDPFLASTFVEHVQDEKLETIKKQLLHDVSTKSLSLEACIKELLMSDHMLRIREQNNVNTNNNNNDSSRRNNNRANRKRDQPDEPNDDEETGKRLKQDQQADVEMKEKPDEATS